MTNEELAELERLLAEIDGKKKGQLTSLCLAYERLGRIVSRDRDYWIATAREAEAQTVLTALIEHAGGDGVTEGDREAAASGYFAWCSGNPVIPDRMKAGQADDHSMVQAFARHRMEERAAIVAWLRSGASHTMDACLVAQDIEAGEHLK